MIRDIKTRKVTKGTIKTLKGTIKTFDNTVRTGGTIKETADRAAESFDPAVANADIMQSAESYLTNEAGRKTIKTLHYTASEAMHIKQRKQAVKDSIKTSQRNIKVVGEAVKNGKRQVKTALKQGRTIIKTAGMHTKVSYAAGTTAQSTFKTAQKTAQASFKAARIVSESTARATRITIKAIFEALRASIQALIAVEQATVASISASGWIALLIIVVVVLAAFIASSALGVFSGVDTNGKTLNTVQQELNQEFLEEISKQKEDLLEYDEIEVRPAEFITEWNNIVSVYSVRCQNEGLVPAEMKDENIKMLRETMWDMITISQSTEEVEYFGSDNSEDSENTEEPKVIGVITISYLNLNEVTSFYNFSNEDKELMMMTLHMSIGDNYVGGSGNGKMINPCPNGTFNGNDYPNYSSGAYHGGRDISCQKGTPVYAAADGIVIKATYMNTSYGNHIMIAHGNDVYTLYAHNSELLVSVGDEIKQGQQIAISGDTGNSSGPHLHFEVRVGGSRYKENNVDPFEWIV
ncbi:MAG: M23 family metallopeptidase [Eubacterium sp.]|nr:M23 family metallopeptidase [Eubacterium sp.]